MTDIRYLAPSSLDEAIGAFAAAGSAARILAGGTDLLVQMRSGAVRPGLIVDIKKIPEMTSIEETEMCIRDRSHVGLTFIRESDIWDKSFTERAPKLGGLVEFYRSPVRAQWTPAGNNVPDYPRLAQLWWQNIGDAAAGTKTPQAAMDSLATAQDSVMERLERSNTQGACGPKLNKKSKPEYWFAKAEKDHTTAPQRMLANEKPRSETIDYDTLLKSWPASPPKRASN